MFKIIVREEILPTWSKRNRSAQRETRKEAEKTTELQTPGISQETRRMTRRAEPRIQKAAPRALEIRPQEQEPSQLVPDRTAGPSRARGHRAPPLPCLNRTVAMVTFVCQLAWAIGPRCLVKYQPRRCCEGIFRWD